MDIGEYYFITDFQDASEKDSTRENWRGPNRIKQLKKQFKKEFKCELKIQFVEKSNVFFAFDPKEVEEHAKDISQKMFYWLRGWYAGTAATTSFP